MHSFAKSSASQREEILSQIACNNPMMLMIKFLTCSANCRICSPSLKQRQICLILPPMVSRFHVPTKSATVPLQVSAKDCEVWSIDLQTSTLSISPEKPLLQAPTTANMFAPPTSSLHASSSDTSRLVSASSGSSSSLPASMRSSMPSVRIVGNPSQPCFTVSTKPTTLSMHSSMTSSMFCARSTERLTANFSSTEVQVSMREHP
mmetsp:Transcript_139132/g.388138  ORF Transcript_139132/g.388138 Transcript_139132/m.388138 type:complete len:205 (+) Transcript_139132:226-840(+)